MKYLKQFGIILGLSLLGELLNYLIPLPVPASIYGLVLMFLCLHFKVIKLGDVKETAVFLMNCPLSSRQVKKEKLRHEGLVPVSKGSQTL